MIVVSAISAKTKNRRIVIQLLKSEEQPEEPPFVVVQTKRLIDAKSRHIVESESVYSIETFVTLSELLIYFREIPEVAKAMNPYLKFDKWKANVYVSKVKEKNIG